MEQTELTMIIAPLTFLPGIGLLILSTSARYAEIIHQVQNILNSDEDYSALFLDCQNLRLKLFKWSLTFLYLSAGFIFIGSLVEAFVIGYHPLAEIVLYTFLILATLSGTSAIVLLIRESFVSSSLVMEQWDHRFK